jgi:ABC-type glycerol-3-phosphate transport system substrate-binding protein
LPDCTYLLSDACVIFEQPIAQSIAQGAIEEDHTVKRWKTAIGIGIAAALALTACTGTAGGGSTDSKTINYWGFASGISCKTAKAVLAEFKKTHPDYTVNAVVMNTDDIDVKLPSVLGKSSGPDLVYTGTEPNHLGRFVQAGQVLSLKSSWTSEGWSDLVPSTQARVSYSGAPYAVGNELETVGLIYNEKLFEKLGISVPTDLAGLEATLNEIKQKDPSITPMDLACGGPCYSGLHMMHALGYATIPTKEVLATTPGGTGNYTDSAWGKMLDEFKSLNNEGLFTKNASGIPDENHQSSFCSGTTAMMASGPWEFSGLAKCATDNPSGFKLGFVGFPVEKGLPFQAYVGTGKAWFLAKSLSSDPAKERAVKDLVAAMTAKSKIKSWIQDDQLIPAISFDQADYTLTEPQKATLKIMSDAGANGGAVDIGFNNSAAETNVWVAGLQGILAGSSTPADLVKKLQSQLEIDRKAWQAAK